MTRNHKKFDNVDQIPSCCREREKERSSYWDVSVVVPSPYWEIFTVSATVSQSQGQVWESLPTRTGHSSLVSS